MSSAAPRVRERIAAEDAVAPDLIDAEVFAVLALRGRRGELTSDQVSAAIEVLLAAPIERVPSGRLLRRAQSLTGALSGTTPCTPSSHDHWTAC
ncbi:MAG TPA: hypothetical protein VMM13_01865 [Euzebya sp.]|nr:hypothetical protein [Euzebya sp.]